MAKPNAQQNVDIRITPWQAYKRLWRYVKPYRWVALLALLANALFGAMDSYLIAGLGPLIDKGFGAAGDGIDVEWMKRLPYVVLLFVIFRAGFAFISEYAMSYVGRMLIQDIRQDLFNHYLALPAEHYDKHAAGHITSTITFNTERLAHATMEAGKEIMRDGFMIVSALYLMFAASWKLSLLFLTVGPVIAFILRTSTKRFRKLSTQLQQSMGVVTHVSNEAVQGYRVVRAFGGQEYEKKRFKSAAENNRRQHIKMVATKAASVGLVQFSAGVGLAIVIAFAANQIIKGSITPGEFAAVASLMMGLLKPLRGLSQLNSQITQGVTAAQTIFDILDTPAEPNKGQHKVERAQGRLVFESLTFSYPTATEPALRCADFVVEKGQTVALVGKSGSGKSTIASLLLRLYEQQDGRILLDGIDIRDYELNNYRQQYAMVTQHVTLFDDTIAANIAYGAQRDYNVLEIEQAARLAQAWDFIQDSPQGLQTMVGENGLRLSGGQRQRLAIARAIFKNAPLLILDEATSALDNQSERLIQSALDELMKHRTTIVIAHRLSTIERADCILVVDKGQIIESGTHAELLSCNGEYSRLHSSQFSENTP